MAEVKGKFQSQAEQQASNAEQTVQYWTVWTVVTVTTTGMGQVTMAVPFATVSSFSDSCETDESRSIVLPKGIKRQYLGGGDTWQVTQVQHSTAQCSAGRGVKVSQLAVLQHSTAQHRTAQYLSLLRLEHQQEGGW